MQKRRNSIANALELRLSCTNPSIWWETGEYVHRKTTYHYFSFIHTSLKRFLLTLLVHSLHVSVYMTTYQTSQHCTSNNISLSTYVILVSLSNYRRLDRLLNPCSSVDQMKRLSSESLAFVGGIHRWLMNSRQEGLVTPKMFPLDDAIIFPETM